MPTPFPQASSVVHRATPRRFDLIRDGIESFSNQFEDVAAIDDELQSLENRAGEISSTWWFLSPLLVRIDK